MKIKILCKNIRKFLHMTLKDKTIKFNFSFNINDFESIKALHDSTMLSLIKNQIIKFKDKVKRYLSKSILNRTE